MPGVNLVRRCGEEGVMSVSRSDAAVIRASLVDPEAFGAIFDRHAVVIHAFLARRLGQDGADGLLGEVFRIAFERRADYRLGSADARPWLFGSNADPD